MELLSRLQIPNEVIYWTIGVSIFALYCGIGVSVYQWYIRRTGLSSRVDEDALGVLGFLVVPVFPLVLVGWCGYLAADWLIHNLAQITDSWD